MYVYERPLGAEATLDCYSQYRRWLGGKRNPMSDLDESPEHKDDSIGVPTLLVAEQVQNTDSNPSSPRSISPARPDTPPIDGDSSTTRPESAGLRSRSHGSSRRLGHTRRSSKPKQEPSDEAVSSARSTGDISTHSESKTSSKAAQPRYATVRPSSPSASDRTGEKNVKDPKRPVPARSNSTSPVATVQPVKGTFDIYFLGYSPF